MKFSLNPASRGAPPLHLLPAVVALLFFPAAAPGADAAPDRPPSKPYTLYLGADLSIERQGKPWPVEGVQGESFVISAEGKRLLVSPREAPSLRVKVDSVLKMTTAYATLAGLKAERVFTPANSPLRRELQAMDLARYNASAVDQAADELRFAQMMIGNAKGELRDAFGNPTPQPLLDSDTATQFTALQSSLSAQNTDLTSVPNAAGRTAADACDALYLSFDLSSRQPLADPYLIAVVRFRANPDDATSTGLLAFAQELPAVDAKPRRVRLFRGGFPRGYQLEECRIHLYDRGNEIPTSTSLKQTAITADEAFQISIVDYVSQNRDQTRPPAPTRDFWPGDLAARLTAKGLNRPVFVKVGKDGKASGFFDDQGCTRPINDPELEAVRPDLHFYPALAKGKATESVVAFDLGQHVE